ncbi:MAG TPA: metallophosphoesterase [bacterium]|nr:metallophosphoesterase [bacterium]
MTRKQDPSRFSRRKFLDGIVRGAGGITLAAAASACKPDTFMDYLSSGTEKVDDRFNESVSGHARQLALPAASSDTFTFLWASDIHITYGHSDLMDKFGSYAKQRGAVFALHSGDCADGGQVDEYKKWNGVMGEYLPCPVFSAIGNHDLYGDGWDAYKKYIGPAAFRFIYGPCDFIFIDTAAGTLGFDQMGWLEKVLDRGGPPNRFILSHYPIYDGAFQTPSSIGNTEECMKLISMFADNNVSYFLCGHKHTGAHYEIRGVHHIISGAGCPYKQIIDDKNHFFRFDVAGSYVSKDKIYFDDVEIV